MLKNLQIGRFRICRATIPGVAVAVAFGWTQVTAQDADRLDEIHGMVMTVGIDSAVAAVRAGLTRRDDAFGREPGHLNRLGYRLLGEGRHELAVRIFELNVELHPHVANGYDSLAEGYLWVGEYDRAIDTYRMLLDVAPRDTVASAELLGLLRGRATEVLEAESRLAADALPIDSPRLRRLEAAIASGDANAVARFRDERRLAGGPLVEPRPGSPGERLITFVWFADEPVENVVVQSWLEGRNLEQRVMRRLGETSLWFRTFPAPAKLRMGYLLSPNDRRLSRYAPIMTQGLRGSTWVRDPLNPRAERGEQDRIWSVLALPGAPDAPWLDSGAEVPASRWVELELPGTESSRSWNVSVYLPPGHQPGDDQHPLVVFFDAYGFVEIDRTPLLLETKIAAGELPPLVAAFVYNPGATRSRDMSCYAPTHDFLRDGLVPTLRRRFGAGSEPERTVIAGRSRSGLGAVCAAFEMPEVFGKALSQSGSFWWAPAGEEDEWLARRFAHSPPRALELYLEAGLLEASPNPETGLSMLTVTRHLRDVAEAAGYRVHYREFAGGHDSTAWRTTLPSALAALLDGV